jgi:hypothetical protein
MFTSFDVKNVRLRPLIPSQASRLAWMLRIATAGAFIGHGGYGAIMAKADWVRYFEALGIPAATVQTASLSLLVGCFEIALGIAVLYKPVRALLLGMLVWKVATEILRPVAGEPAWEFIERASNMIAPLALIYVRGWPKSLREWLS